MAILTYSSSSSVNHVVTIPLGVTSYTVYATGSGGSGNIGDFISGQFYSGAGGGSGYTQTASFEKSANERTRLRLTIGRTPKVAGSNGNPTIVSLDYNVIILVANGGQGGGSGRSNIGGAGFMNGMNGSVSNPSSPTPMGGNGGNTLLYAGGLGGLQSSENGTNDNIKGQSGKFGSGGGGSCSGTFEFGLGGGGFLIISY